MGLGDIRSPEDLKGLSWEELAALACEIRETIIRGVAAGGGHLASNLGVVELSIALHYVFDSPRDRIVWDVGHQSYPHKLLTGRLDRFHTLRKMGGLAGFPKRDESPHDAFDTGHSSTSISAATGLIEARDRRGERFKVIAVIGDGSMTAGLAFEGLNHAGQLRKDLIVVLNDNEMSISQNVGAMSSYLNRILTGHKFQRLRKEARQVIESIPRVGGQMARLAGKAEEGLKGMFLPGMIFEELGFQYVGPIDGHNIAALAETFRNIRGADRPILVHVITKKGKGYEFSEKDPCVFHGIGPFEPETGSPLSSGTTWSDAFGSALADLAEGRPEVVAVTAAMMEGTGLGHFNRRHPNRIYDVGIAEPHAVTFAAGMAAGGMRPVVAIYSTFLQRAYDEIVHDVCLQRLPVVFAVDRAGIVGDDGPTHNGAFDLSFLRHIPGLTVMAPKDAAELRLMLALALEQEGPSAIRFPRGRVPKEDASAAGFKVGEAEVLMDGPDIAILAVGSTVLPAMEAARLLASEDGVSATVVNMRFVKPLDEAVLLRVARLAGRILTVEDGALQGGFGSAVIEALHARATEDETLSLGRISVRMLGIPDEFVEQGTQAELRQRYGIDRDGIRAAARAMARDISHCARP